MTVGNIIMEMTRSTERWNRISSFITDVIKTKEIEDRMRETN